MNKEESIQQIETLIEAWQLDEADLNQTDINAMQALLKENQELKKKYENAVADYETTMFEKEQLNSLVNSCQEEIRQLKKQIEETDRKLFLTKNELDMRQKSIDNKLNQQKEFIKYLEDYLKLFDYMCIDEQADYDMIEEILRKYKSIIGDDK